MHFVHKIVSVSFSHQTWRRYSSLCLGILEESGSGKIAEEYMFLILRIDVKAHRKRRASANEIV